MFSLFLFRITALRKKNVCFFTLVPEVFLDISPHERTAREPRRGEKEKPLVTLDLNLTFVQTPGSGSDLRTRIAGRRLIPFYLEVPRPSCTLFVIASTTFEIVADENIFANTHIDPGQVGQKILLLTTRVEALAADKHVIAKLPLVPF